MGRKSRRKRERQSLDARLMRVIRAVSQRNTAATSVVTLPHVGTPTRAFVLGRKLRAPLW